MYTCFLFNPGIEGIIGFDPIAIKSLSNSSISFTSFVEFVLNRLETDFFTKNNINLILRKEAIKVDPVKKKVHFKMELKEGSVGNLLVIIKFDPKASNFKDDFTWCPTLDELNVLNKAREAVMENK